MALKTLATPSVTRLSWRLWLLPVRLALACLVEGAAPAASSATAALGSSLSGLPLASACVATGAQVCAEREPASLLQEVAKVARSEAPVGAPAAEVKATLSSNTGEELAASELRPDGGSRHPFGKPARRLGATPLFLTAKASQDPPVGFDRRSGVYVPFGPGSGFGFGMGAAEKTSYDPAERYLYTVSEQGAVNVVDYDDPDSPIVVSGLALNLADFVAGGTPTDIQVCRDVLFVSISASDLVSDGTVLIFSAARRSPPSFSPGLNFQGAVAVGPNPDYLSPNAACTVVAVANEGEGKYDGALHDPEGSVDLISGFSNGSQPRVQRISFGSLGTDEDLISKGVHLPLPLNAMEYWQDFSGLGVNFSMARAKYSTAMNLEPEYLGWSGDGMTLFVNLQENNAVLAIRFSLHGHPAGIQISSLGLKDWSSAGGTAGLDLVSEDKDCVLANYRGFSSLRQADGIAVVNVNGNDYVLTANEGDDKSYGGFDELQRENRVLGDSGKVLLEGAVATWKSVHSHLAKNAKGADKATRIGLGSTAVNYSDPSRPVIKRLVSHGARGISIYKERRGALKLVWDSGSEFEREQCSAFAWAHNGIQDEEFAPLGGVLYNTTTDQGLKDAIEENNDPGESGCDDGGDGQPGACPLGETVDERSPKDGAAPEAIVAGVACGRLLAVTATEKQSSAFVYDITDILHPRLLFVRHLSPISQTHNPGVAYDARVLGEIDPESIIFVEAEHSPSGKPGVFFAGAWSGTVSFWEFTCPE